MTVRVSAATVPCVLAVAKEIDNRSPGSRPDLTMVSILGTHRSASLCQCDAANRNDHQDNFIFGFNGSGWADVNRLGTLLQSGQWRLRLGHQLEWKVVVTGCNFWATFRCKYAWYYYLSVCSVCVLLCADTQIVS
jgi:hypothetical protein